MNPLKDFTTLLAPPPAANLSGQANSGDKVFSDIGYEGCRARALTSGPSLIAALSKQTYHPFSDFLVHDMGSLGDSIPGNGDVGLREMRTALSSARRTMSTNERVAGPSGAQALPARRQGLSLISRTHGPDRFLSWDQSDRRPRPKLHPSSRKATRASALFAV